ncbi:hypothetical protein QJQ45_014217 [Haematococcus lacustris]|nr:hypothetical protein QJQ45_014217 [Haematococcus lacustris]
MRKRVSRESGCQQQGMRTPVQASALLLFLLVVALRTGISAPSFNAITSTSRIAYYREQWAVARHEKERLEKLGLMLDLDTVYKSPPLPGPTAQPLQGVVMPLEADPVEAVLIAVDDVDAKTDDLQATLMWQAIIRTAQRQGIRVIAYTVRSDFNTATLAQIKRALASDPDISIEEVSFIEDYQVDSIWMRDYGPLFVFGNVPQAMVNASGTSSPQAAAGSLLLREGRAGKLEQQLTLEWLSQEQGRMQHQQHAGQQAGHQARHQAEQQAAQQAGHDEQGQRADRQTLSSHLPSVLLQQQHEAAAAAAAAAAAQLPVHLASLTSLPSQGGVGWRRMHRALRGPVQAAQLALSPTATSITTSLQEAIKPVLRPATQPGPQQTRTKQQQQHQQHQQQADRLLSARQLPSTYQGLSERVREGATHTAPLASAALRVSGDTGSNPGPAGLLPAWRPQAQVLSAVYFSDRPEDCQLPDDFASRAGLPHTQVPLLFEGGNLLPNGQGICIMSDRVLFVSFRGSDLSLPERLVLVEASLRPFGCTELIVVEALTADITGHVDMWMSWPDAHTLMVGQYTYEQSPWDHVLMQHTIARLQRLSRGRFEVVVMPMPSNCQAVQRPGSDTWQAPETCPDELEPLTRTYLNALYLNDYVVVPVYDEARLQESAALDLWERVAGGRYAGRVVTARADMMIEWSGSIHCMTRAVPRGTLPPDFWSHA